jgi:hypothetical protein
MPAAMNLTRRDHKQRARARVRIPRGSGSVVSLVAGRI